MSRVELSRYDNGWFDPGRPFWVRALWMFGGLPLLRWSWLPSSALRCALLRLFGARIGKGVVIRQHVTVKYPWHLEMGSHCWIGERVWIDNLTLVRLGQDVCVSQGAYVCTGNHDWTDPRFGLRVQAVTMEDQSWVGAQSVLLPGVTLHEGAVAGAGSVVSRSVGPWQIVSGNPAVVIRRRQLSEVGVVAAAKNAREAHQ